MPRVRLTRQCDSASGVEPGAWCFKQQTVGRYSKLHTCPGPKRQVLDVKNKGTHASHITDDSFVQWSWETQQWTAYGGTRQPHSTTSGSGQVLAKAFAWCHLQWQPNWYIRREDRGRHQCRTRCSWAEASKHWYFGRPVPEIQYKRLFGGSEFFPQSSNQQKGTAQQHGCRREPHGTTCLLRRLLGLEGGHKKHKTCNKKPGCLGYIGDEILPRNMWIIINHHHDPYLTTRIQWKVRVYFFVAHLTNPSFWLPSFFQGSQ